MQKYPNGDKVTTKNPNFGKAKEKKLLCDEGITQIYLSSDLLIHEAEYESLTFHLYASSSLDYGICPYCGHHSRSVHSKYVRTIQEIVVGGYPFSNTLGHSTNEHIGTQQTDQFVMKGQRKRGRMGGLVSGFYQQVFSVSKEKLIEGHRIQIEVFRLQNYEK